jgi:AraC family transcriptional regulator
MMSGKTSAEQLDRHIRGHLLAGRMGLPASTVIAQIFAREREQEGFIVPAVAEPLIVWILKGRALVEERDLGGAWSAAHVAAGDFFITDSDAPYELRWRSLDESPFEVMHLYLGLPLLEKAAADVLGTAERILLREVSGAQDVSLGSYIDLLQREISQSGNQSSLYLESVAQALAIQLVRQYRDESRSPKTRRSALPAFRLRKVTDLMARNLPVDFDLALYAGVAGLSVAHFSRQFKQATGLAPSQYFIRMRIAEARRLLRETDRSIISIGMDVGYMSPSHFAQVFRKETGATPREYRAS